MSKRWFFEGRLLTGKQPWVVQRTGAYLLVMTPPAILASVLVAARRRKTRGLGGVLTSAALELLAANSVAGILLVTLLPTGKEPAPPALVPFTDVHDMLRTGMPLSEILVQVGGNVLLFMPLGFFVPLALRNLDGMGRMALLAGALTVSVETAQYLLPHGRTASTGDALLNLAGAMTGYLMQSALREALPPESLKTENRKPMTDDS